MSEKNAAFHRLAAKRTETVVDQIRILSNLSGPSYEWNAAEVMSYLDQVQTALGEAQKRFMEQKNWDGFKPPTDEDLPEFPAIGSIWEHTSGRLYRVEEITNQETGRQDRYPTSVSYRNIHNHKPYSRRLTEWYRSMKPVEADVVASDLSASNMRENSESEPAEQIHPSITKEQRRKRTIGQLITEAANDPEMLPEMIVLQREVISNLQQSLDECRAGKTESEARP